MSRLDRQTQLNKLENVIAKKKQEIQAKLEAQKKKETEEALLKIQKNSSDTLRRPFWKRQSDNQSSKTAAKDVAVTVPMLNVFSNDGSFLDQFKKLSKSSLKADNVDFETLGKVREAEDKEKERRKIIDEEKTQRQIERNMRERERELRKIEREKEREREREKDRENSRSRSRSPKRVPLDANIKVDLPPPGVVQLIPQVQLITPVVIAPLPQLVLNSTPMPPQFTTNEIQLQAAGLSAPTSLPPQVPMVPQVPQPVLGPSAAFNTLQHALAGPAMLAAPQPIPPPSLIPSPLPMIPQTIPPPSPMQVDRIPPPPSPPQLEMPIRQRQRNSLFCPEIPLPTSMPLPEQVPPAGRARNASSGLDSGVRHLAKMIANSGDHAEEILRVAHKDDPALRFLFDTGSGKYQDFRRTVEEFRTGMANESEEESDYSDFDSKRAEKYDPAQVCDSDSDEQKNEEKYDPEQCGSDSEEDKRKIVIKIEQPQAGLLYFQSTEETPSTSAIKIEPGCETPKPGDEIKRKRKSRWSEKAVDVPAVVIPNPIVTLHAKDPGLVAYAKETFGSLNLTEADWKRAEDHYKVNVLYQNMMKKRAEVEKLALQGKFKYEYDSDEDTDGGTWEHKLRTQEMAATKLWAEELNRQSEGKHHIGDFLPPNELERFMENYSAAKSGREPDLSDYKEYKLKEDNVGYKLLQKMGWSEGQGLGQEGQGITNPVNKTGNSFEHQGLGLEKPDRLRTNDDEFDAYRKRMMLAYRFRPNPLNNPRRPYY